MKSSNLDFLYLLTEKQYKLFPQLVKQSQSFYNLLLECDLNGFEKVELSNQDSLEYSPKLKPNNILLIPYKYKHESKTFYVLSPWRITSKVNGSITILSLLGLEKESFQKVKPSRQDQLIKLARSHRTNPDIIPEFPYETSSVRRYLNKAFTKNFSRKFLNILIPSRLSSDLERTLTNESFYLPLITDIIPDFYSTTNKNKYSTGSFSFTPKKQDQNNFNFRYLNEVYNIIPKEQSAFDNFLQEARYFYITRSSCTSDDLTVFQNETEAKLAKLGFNFIMQNNNQALLITTGDFVFEDDTYITPMCQIKLKT